MIIYLQIPILLWGTLVMASTTFSTGVYFTLSPFTSRIAWPENNPERRREHWPSPHSLLNCPPSHPALTFPSLYHLIPISPSSLPIPSVSPVSGEVAKFYGMHPWSSSHMWDRLNAFSLSGEVAPQGGSLDVLKYFIGERDCNHIYLGQHGRTPVSA